MLVRGGRTFSDRETLERVLDRIKPGEIIHGAASGADTLADGYAWRKRIPCWRFSARWRPNSRFNHTCLRRLKCGKPSLSWQLTKQLSG